VEIINTGGTFNKVYDPVKGELVVSQDNSMVERVLDALKLSIPVRGILYKDSLDMDEGDRSLLLQTILESPSQEIVIVHGTDTMDLSAQVVASGVEGRSIVFTGAMVPISIDPTEGAGNLMLALSHLLYNRSPGVFIAMHGLLAPYDQIYKERERGLFCLKR